MNPEIPKDIAARNKVLENPFNSCHQGDGVNPPWASRSASELRSELKRRGLSHEGGKAACVKRIKEQNEWILTPAGCLDIYHRKLSLLHKQYLPNRVPFTRFRKLPPEIRLMIWKFSLPGQRVLTASCGNRRTGLLNFYEKNNPYNPTLLSVCRESRYVALKHYRLCFGTTNIYADLSLDILYFGNNWHHQVLGPGYNVCNWETWSKSKNQRIPTKMNAAVMADLEKITHLAILSRLWRYRNPGRRGSTGADLRIDAMSTFPNLKQLTIVTREAADSSGTPGYIEFTPDKTQTWESVCWKEFSTYQLSDAEKVKGVPGIQVVSASSTSHIPGDDWNRDYGEPFYPPELASPPNRRSARLMMVKDAADPSDTSKASTALSMVASDPGLGIVRKCVRK